MMGSTYNPKNPPLVSPIAGKDEWKRGFSNWMYAANQGKLMARGSVTLTAGSFSTSVEDARCNLKSFIEFQPGTANAAAEMTGKQLYVSTVENGRFVITHQSNAQTDRTFTYTIMG